jgi:hypothetical protein
MPALAGARLPNTDAITTSAVTANDFRVPSVRLVWLSMALLSERIGLGWTGLDFKIIECSKYHDGDSAIGWVFTSLDLW